jgi:hypothetical protein
MCLGVFYSLVKLHAGRPTMDEYVREITRGAHLLLQTRAKTLDQELGAVFHRWHPDLQLEAEPQAAYPQVLDALVSPPRFG